jgi:hypothetical protein
MYLFTRCNIRSQSQVIVLNSTVWWWDFKTGGMCMVIMGHVRSWGCKHTGCPSSPPVNWRGAETGRCAGVVGVPQPQGFHAHLTRAFSRSSKAACTCAFPPDPLAVASPVTASFVRTVGRQAGGQGRVCLSPASRAALPAGVVLRQAQVWAGSTQG